MIVLEGPTKGKPIPRGSIIFCVGCKAVLVAMRVVLYGGTAKVSGFFESREMKIVRGSGMSAYCPYCGKSFLTRKDQMYYIAPARSFGMRLAAFMWRMEG